MEQKGVMLQPEIYKKLEPKEILLYAVKKYNIRRFASLFSGGKDSYVTAVLSEQAIKEINAELGLNITFEVVHCYTGTGSFENFDYVLQIAKERGWKLSVEYPDANEDYPQEAFLKLLSKKGFLGRKFHNQWLKALKFNSMRRFHRKNPDAWLISGKSPTNSKRRKKQMDDAFRRGITLDQMLAGINDGLPFVMPMFYKTKADTWQIVKNLGLRLVDSYTWMSHSLECLCPAYATIDELRQLEAWFPGLATDIKILNDQYGGWHWVRDKRGRKYFKNFGTWGVPPRRKTMLEEDQEQLFNIEDLACFDCSPTKLETI